MYRDSRNFRSSSARNAARFCITARGALLLACVSGRRALGSGLDSLGLRGRTHRSPFQQRALTHSFNSPLRCNARTVSVQLYVFARLYLRVQVFISFFSLLSCLSSRPAPGAVICGECSVWRAASSWPLSRRVAGCDAVGLPLFPRLSQLAGRRFSY
ncbi:hypothetical protein C8F04DRAFT_1091856 [Mycena alexandri]|uniref:Uncharacterized protein n=1 Tax=Mycena alexandri TaxID=1745969 RepID=A0AAD6T1G9_9AGAR|nr:hypothetical protein C8F04DRAFT_1091856 [Mycena alexandri]